MNFIEMNHSVEKMANKAIDSSQRLFEKNTVNSSIRNNCNKNKNDKYIPDSLDSILSSVYNHVTDLFIDSKDTVLQLENAKFNPIEEKMKQELNEMRRNYFHHPLILGGLSEKLSPHSVKLICIGPHTPITNAGYSRQPVDGNIFNY